MPIQSFDSVSDGLIITDRPALSATSLQAGLLQFVMRDESYRCKFLQTQFEYAFDGYSYPGQTDSTHQAPEDQLHSFVFSNFHAVDRFPIEFRRYMQREWRALVEAIFALECSLLEQAPENIRTLHRTHMGHMLSANYYPPGDSVAESHSEKLRLSEHPDVSLLTVFPFGLDQAFEYQDKQGRWRRLPETDNMIAFPGYLYQWLSGGEVAALNHRVAHSPVCQQSRSSFAVFSLPLHNTLLQRPGASSNAAPSTSDTLSAEAYFTQYLSQWDY